MGFFRDEKHKKSIFDAININQKRNSWTRVVDVFLLTLKLYTLFSYIFLEASARVLLKVATNDLFRGPKNERS